MIDRFFGLSKKIRLSVVSFGLGLIALCLILVGQSYAIFSGTTTDTKEQIVKLGNLEVVLNEPSTGIDLGLSPMSDVEGLLQEEVYNFTVENTGSANAMYKVLLIDDEASKASYTGTLLDKGLIKIGLEVNGKEIGPLTLSELDDLLNEKELRAGKKDTYKLRLWISEDANLDEISEQQVFLKLKLEAEQYFSEIVGNLDNSGANEPVLSSNMIPVYYDSTKDVWKKADVNNIDESNKWYDYDKKMWANAVTVDENIRKESITSNKSVSVSGVSNQYKTYTSFTSGGYNINSANSMSKITVNINSAVTFGFKATVSSEASYDKLTVTVAKNGGSDTTVANAISGANSNTYSDSAKIGDVYVITVKYAKDSSVNKNNDNGVLDTFTYPSNSHVTYTDSATAGGTSGQNWTASGETTSTVYSTKVGSGIKYNTSTNKYDLVSPASSAISSSLVGKYVCPNGSDTSCTSVYKIVSASNTITKVDEYRMVSAGTRSDLINAKAGTEIPMDGINTMWVWVPRYTYTYLNTNTPQEIKIKFESGTNSSGTIKCTDAVTGTSSTSETCTDTTNGGLKAGTSTYTHPAFWWDKNDNNIREEGEELTGIWVGKFEVSSDTTCTASNNAAVGSGCNLQTIRPQIKPNVTSWRGAQVGTFFNGIQKMRESGNKYGFSTTDETHLMKNMEWGAVTYLSHSKYGINKEIAINSANTFTTGCGPQSEGSTSSGATCNSYTTALGQSASTTGNVYGVYDMSGGSWEYMMGNMVYSNGQQMSGYQTNNNYNSAFTGVLSGGTSFTGTYAFPSKRYYDKYSYGTSDTEYTRGKLGDATKEMAPVSSNNTSWYSDYAYFPYSSYPWFIRGGYYSNGANAGAFSFPNNYGSAYTNNSARAVLLVAGTLVSLQ